jgi:hypothetical protein
MKTRRRKRTKKKKKKKKKRTKNKDVQWSFLKHVYFIPYG